MAKKKTTPVTNRKPQPKQKPKAKVTKAVSKTGIPKTKKNPKGAGRAQKSKLDDPKVRSDFLAAAALGANVEACCAYANIHKSTYYKYVTDHPNFSDEVEAKQNLPYLTAVQTIVGAIKTDPKIALKYLERKYKGEFSIRKELTGAGGEKLFEGMSDEEIRRFITSGND